MEKRVSSRAIIINEGKLVAIFRRKIKKDGSVKEYYVIPGGGQEEGETLEENVIREIKEELSVDATVIKYVGKTEEEETINHYFLCTVNANVYELSGPEKDRNTEDNYYEIVLLDEEEIDGIDINAKDFIHEAFKSL